MSTGDEKPNGGGDGPSLHVDSDWKAEAERERAKLAAQEAQQQPAAGGREGELPPADFRTLVSMLASQAVMGLGAVQDPNTKQIVLDFEGSRLAIDLLAMLEEKTKGNLEKDEAEELQQAVVELRSRYVEVLELYRRHQAAGGATGAAPAGGGSSPPPGDGGEAGSGGGSPIITP